MRDGGIKREGMEEELNEVILMIRKGSWNGLVGKLFRRYDEGFLGFGGGKVKDDGFGGGLGYD